MDKTQKNFETLEAEIWVRSDRPFSYYPLGTKAKAAGGGYWIKNERGWKWCTGATFPAPGGDWNGEVCLPPAVESLPEPAVQAYTIAPADWGEGDWLTGTTADGKFFSLTKKSGSDEVSIILETQGQSHRNGVFENMDRAKEWIEKHNHTHLLKFLRPL